jgi:hypothetical protein
MDLTERKLEIDRQKQERQQNFQRLVQGNFSAVPNVDELFKLINDLSSDEIKKLLEVNASFKAKYDEFNRVRTPEELEQEKSQAEAKAAAKAEADRLAAEEAAQAAQPSDGETLFEGVEKLGVGSYKLTVDPGDGSNPEIFFGATQAELFKKLRQSKAHATKELRRRRNAVKITDDLKALRVETVNYPPLVQPLKLTPDEIYKLTEQQKDPSTVLEATRKLRQASLTDEECARLNQAELQRRYQEGFHVANEWVKSHDEFYNCRENLLAMQELMGALDWAMTPRNIDLAFKVLTEQGVFLDRPGTESESDIPFTVAPTLPSNTPAVPVVPAPPVKRLRPASATGAMPTRRIETTNLQPKKFVLTVEEYNATPASQVQARYRRDAAYAKAVDDLIAGGKI